MARILVVDDEAGVRTSLQMLLKGEFDVCEAESVDHALRVIADTPPDLILLDLVMPDRNGLELLAELRERGDTVPVIILTATATVSAAVKAMQRGASDFVTKPFELEALRIKVRQLVEHRALQEEVVRLRDEVEGRQRLCDLLGRSAVMQKLFRQIEQVAGSRASVLITGESGTGKELAARALHTLSPRSQKPFVAVNCGAIPSNLVESALFGHEKGSFTGADKQHIGHFEAASGGTLLLDEIGELDLAVQVKLLRALQELVIERVGSSVPIPVDVRIIAATNRDLDQAVDEGSFRADLFYRVNVVPIEMPALRERREDIELLARSFLRDSALESGREISLTQNALAALERYEWPGNVRELQNAILRGHTMCGGQAIEFDDLPAAIGRTSLAARLLDDQSKGVVSFEEAVGRFESQLIAGALEQTRWNQTRAADRLQITRRQLKLKMDRYEIQPPDSDEKGGDDDASES